MHWARLVLARYIYLSLVHRIDHDRTRPRRVDASEPKGRAPASAHITQRTQLTQREQHTRAHVYAYEGHGVGEHERGRTSAPELALDLGQ